MHPTLPYFNVNGAYISAEIIISSFVNYNAISCCCPGFPPDLLAVDHKRLSWYNKDKGRLYSVLKEDETDRRLLKKDIAGVEDILGFGSHLQPLPGKRSAILTLCAQYKVISRPFTRPVLRFSTIHF